MQCIGMVFMVFVCIAMLQCTISIFCFFSIKSISLKFLLNPLQYLKMRPNLPLVTINQIQTVFHKSYSYQDDSGHKTINCYISIAISIQV